MYPIKSLITGIVISTTLTFSMAGMAVKPDDRTTLVDEAIAVNTSGPFAGAFDTLIAVLLSDAAYDLDGSLVKKLSGNGQYTVFAPTDGAFATLFEVAGCNNINLAQEPELVRSVLKYHVAKGNRDSGEVVSSDQIKTLEGNFFWVEYVEPTMEDPGGVFLDDIAGQTAKVIVPDATTADNGIIHAIDTVILPVEINLDACVGDAVSL